MSTLPNAGAVNLTIGRLTSALSNSGTANNISVAVVDMNLWLYRVHAPNAVSIPKEIYIKQFTATLHTITGTHDEFNVDFKKNRRLTHIACAFVQKKGAMKYSPTDLSSGYYIGADSGAGVDTASAVATTEAIVYSNSPIVQLQNLRVEYAGSVYPFQPYELNFDTKALIDTSKASKGTYRSFYDFCNFSDGLRDRNGVLLSSDQYIVSPIVLFKTFQNPDNDSNTCLCTIDLRNAVTNCQVLVMAMYDEVVSLSFDEYGKYKGFEIH